MSPLKSCPTIDNKTACSLPDKSILNCFDRLFLLIARSRFISFLKTLRVCLNLKLYKNYCIKSIHNEAILFIWYLMDKLLTFLVLDAHIWSQVFICSHVFIYQLSKMLNYLHLEHVILLALAYFSWTPNSVLNSIFILLAVTQFSWCVNISIKLFLHYKP